jgi:hypothetical protein
MPENLHSKDKPVKGINIVLLGIVLIIFTGLTFTSCKHEWEKKEKHTINTDSISNNFINIADSINYGVVVRARDKNDEWQNKWLRSFDRREFVDFIFESVYSGRLQAYDYFEDEPVSIDQIKKLEDKEEFDRSKIGKIQFKERWYFDPSGLKMYKEVHSVMLAYEVYRENGKFRGYKPAFKVYLNDPKGN